MKKILPFILVIIFLILGFFLLKSESEPTSNFVRIAGQDIKVEIVTTPVEQAQGLSGRQGLNENEGMLFVFEQSGNYPFWMKDMKFAIDIIWITEGKKVVYIQKDARPESFPLMYDPKANAKYVLEVVSGFSEKNNLKVGDSVEF